MYTTAAADFSGEAAAKGTISVGKYGDLAILSADYFSVPDEDISRIESLCTVVGGRIVYAAGEYEDTAPPLPAVPYDWSPIRHYGGYQQQPPGVRQANGLADAAAASEERREWRELRGEIGPNAVHAGHHGCF
jgi:Amidohydrolase family